MHWAFPPERIRRGTVDIDISIPMPGFGSVVAVTGRRNHWRGRGHFHAKGHEPESAHWQGGNGNRLRRRGYLRRCGRSPGRGGGSRHSIGGCSDRCAGGNKWCGWCRKQAATKCFTRKSTLMVSAAAGAASSVLPWMHALGAAPSFRSTKASSRCPRVGGSWKPRGRRSAWVLASKIKRPPAGGLVLRRERGAVRRTAARRTSSCGPAASRRP